MFIVIYNNTVHVSNLLVYILLFHFTVLGSGVTLPFGAPLLIFCRPPNFFYCLQKKKGRHFFSGFSYRLIAPLELFVPPNIFSRPSNAKLAEIWSILLPRRTIFRLKNSKFGNMLPPKVPPPCIAGVAGAVVTPLVLGPVLFNIYRYTLHISTIPLLFNVTDITF